MNVAVKYTKIYMQLNRNKIKYIEVDKGSRCVIKYKGGCKFRIDKLNFIYKQYKKLLISMLNGWNQIGFGNIVW